jgi:hypothetical protein
VRLRILLGLGLLLVPATGTGQEILIRRVVTPPPTTFAGLLKAPGGAPAARCEFPAVTIDTASLITLPFRDTASLRLPPGWSELPLYEGQDTFSQTRLIGPDSSRALFRRHRNGSQGRSFPMYRNGEKPVGVTCMVERGVAGAIWSFYPPDPDAPASPRPFRGYGDFITSDGRWYAVMVSGATPEQRLLAASTITAVALLP